jgi:hypothetical protein
MRKLVVLGALALAALFFAAALGVPDPAGAKKVGKKIVAFALDADKLDGKDSDEFMLANLFGDDVLGDDTEPPSVEPGLGIAECVLSEVTLLASTTQHPDNWLPAEGQVLPIEENQALFDLIGNTYGGDGEETFALPDLKDLGPGGVRYYICVEGVFPGEEEEEGGITEPEVTTPAGEEEEGGTTEPELADGGSE